MTDYLHTNVRRGDGVDRVAAVLQAGELAIIPTDTVPGLAAHALDERAVARLYDLKGRAPEQPTAMVCASLEQLHEVLPAMSDRAAAACAALLPGPWTLIIANPGGVAPWLTGASVGPIGVRVPAGAHELPPVAATSVNEPGELAAAAPTDMPARLRDGVSVVLSDDRPTSASVCASTVLDLTAWEARTGDVRVLRDEASRSGVAIAVLTMLD